MALGDCIKCLERTCDCMYKHKPESFKIDMIKAVSGSSVELLEKIISQIKETK